MSNQEGLDDSGKLETGIDDAFDELRNRVEPKSLIPKLLLAALVQAVMIFGLIGIITLIFGSLPWLWWTGIALLTASSAFSVFAYFKARKAYKKLNEVENSLGSMFK